MKKIRVSDKQLKVYLKKRNKSNSAAVKSAVLSQTRLRGGVTEAANDDK